MTRDTDMIHSMVSWLPTLPALLERSDNPPRNRLSLLQMAIVLIAGGAHAAAMAWPFPFGFGQGQAVGGLSLIHI